MAGFEGFPVDGSHQQQLGLTSLGVVDDQKKSLLESSAKVYEKLPKPKKETRWWIFLFSPLPREMIQFD